MDCRVTFFYQTTTSSMKHLITIDKPKNIYLVGTVMAEHSFEKIELDDDYADISIVNTKSKECFETDGSVQFFTRKKLLKNKEVFSDVGEGVPVSVLFLPNFQGDIYIRVVDKTGNDITPVNLDVTDSILDQISNGSVELVLPEGANISKISSIYEFAQEFFEDDDEDDEDSVLQEVEIDEDTMGIGAPAESSVSDINDAIQTARNGKSNITANPKPGDLDLGETLDDDPTFEEYNKKMTEFKTEIETSLSSDEADLSKLNKVIDGNDYWAAFYKTVFYKEIVEKYFSREYNSHPKPRFERIKAFLQERIFQYKPYLESIKYVLDSEEAIEAYEKEWICSTLLTKFFPAKQAEKKKEEAPAEKIDFKKAGQEISESTKNNLSDFLRKVESGEIQKENEIPVEVKVLSEFEKADVKGRITILFKKVMERATVLDKEEEGIIWTYINELYNPETTTLDDKNLLLNLSLVSRMQDFGIMKWAFDEERVKISNTEIQLHHKWWDDIMSENIEKDLKLVKIVEKDLNLAFYKSFIFDLLKHADQMAFTEESFKLKKILEDGADDRSREDMLLDNILKKTTPESIIFLSPDMGKYIEVDTPINEELGDRGQVKYLGIWNERHVFVINTENISGMKGYSNEIIFVNRGNSYVLNPAKPIVYFNLIENPFLERGQVKWFAGAEFEIFMDKSGRMSVDDRFFG